MSDYFDKTPETEEVVNPNVVPEGPKIRDQAPATRRDRGEWNVGPEGDALNGYTGHDDKPPA